MNMTIKTKALLSIISIIVVISFIHTYESINTEKDLMRKEIFKRAETVTSLATKNGELPILSGSPRLLKEIVVFLKARSDISAVTFYDSHMKELIHDGPVSGPIPDLSPDIPVFSHEEKDFFVFYAPIFTIKEQEDLDILHEDKAEKTVKEHIGWVRLLFSKSSMQETEKKIAERAILLMLFFTAVGSVLVYFLINMVTRPLSAIVSLANEVAEGNFSRNIDIKRHDEIGTLANAFQRMKTTIQQGLHQTEGLVLAVKEGRLDSRGNVEPFSGEWRNLVNGANLLIDAFAKVVTQLQEAKDSLEKRVEQRTEELALANSELLCEIKERKHSEEALYKSEQRYRLVFENSPVSIWEEDFSAVKAFLDNLKQSGIVDINTYFLEHPEALLQCAKLVQVINVNKAARELHGAANAEELLSDLSNLFTSESFETFRQELICLWNGGTEMTSDTVVKTLNGELRHVTICFSVCPGHEETLAKIILSLIDITERKQAEQEREKLQEQFLQAQKMESVGRLAGGVAHDFNNKLGVIMGYADMALMKMEQSQPFFKHFQEIQKAAESSANLTRQLLAFARKQTISPVVLNLNQTVESMLKMLRRLIGEDISLTWMPGTELWQVNMDPTQIDQILANLCVNARDAISGVGKVSIQTQNVSFDEKYCADHLDATPGDYVKLTVSDDGCGMDKETQHKLFEPFFTTKEVGKGTGLGLATVYGIIKQNNGFINVYSEPGYGTIFKIYLPRHDAAPEQVTEENLELPTAMGQETILLVEDETAVLSMVKVLLESLGYKVLATSTPDEAIRIAKECSEGIRLLLTDVVMPEMTGKDLAQQLTILYPKLRKLFMSGYTSDIIAHHGILEKDVNFIQKPFSTQALAIKVREVLDSK